MAKPVTVLKESDPSPRIRSFTFEEYVERVKSFHGFEAIGVIIGGFMVDRAYKNLPHEGLYDALCETRKCLPDAIQLLTPCTIGNGWLTVVNFGRYALTLYDKETGEGVRVFVDPDRIEEWPEIKSWFFKLKPKKEQDDRLLMEQVRQAGGEICGVQPVRVAGRLFERRHRGGFALCPSCKEAYPAADGPICVACREQVLYEANGNQRLDAREER
jgi:formylmethanofuran dehydrogenase subunit E